MSNITDWIKYELYPSLFESIDRALPEHKFNRYPGGWRSKTYLNGTPHKDRADKTVITTKAPGVILEQGGRVMSLVDYVMERDRVDFIQAVKTLSEVAGLQLPKAPDEEGYQRYRDQATLLEDCNSYFVWCLENSPGAEEIINYLQGRGYSPEEVKAMELGYIPSQDKLYKHLSKKNYSQTLIDEVLRLHKGIGSTHRLTIPWRSGGSVKGFKFRTTENISDRYLNSSGLDKIGGFFNLSGVKGDKDIVIVEGELDSLSSTVKGVNNVVATGGSSINPEQIKDALRRGARSFTICFDREPGKEAETSKKINSAIEVILGEGVNRVYIVTLPDLGGDKTDPDRLIKESGADSFKKAIAEALPYYEYRLQAIINKYSKIEDERGELQPRDIDNFLDEVIENAVKLEPTDKDRYLSLFTSMEEIKALGITEESLELTVERLRTNREKETQAKEIKKLLSEAKELQDKGETDKALELLDSKVKEVKTITTSGLLPPLMSFKALLDEISTMPPAYKTGYLSLDEFMGFTPGAITLIAGRPGHGKTTLLYNLLLEMSRLYPEESFYYFTYEEPVKNLSVKILNRLTATDLSQYIKESKDLAKPSNYEFIKAYIRKGRTDIGEIEEGKRKLQELIDRGRIKVIDRNYSVEELHTLIAYLKKKEKIGAIIIDYIQRMRTDRKTQDKRTEIAHISDQVLQIAKDSGLPIILGAQLNREATAKPRLENLKEAGNLEEDANTVISVYNDSREQEENSQGETYKGVREVELELKILKNREGDVNQTAILLFDKWTGVIGDKKTTPGYNPF
jgi:DNA primase catalytic core